MTLTQRLFKAKKKKAGFTLVELVIVIAILAVLAGIAIPVINTTIKAAKISRLETDCTTVNMLVKEAVNTSKVHLRATTWNGQNYVTATIGDVCEQSDLPWEEEDFFSREISGETYSMVWTDSYAVKVSGPSFEDTGTPITGEELIKNLEPED